MQLQSLKIIAILISVNWLVPCQAQEEYVVRITASDCSYTNGAGKANILTGFILNGKIMTALHGVCGCNTIAADDAYGRDLGKMKVYSADLGNDVAILTSEQGKNFNSGFKPSNVPLNSLGGKDVKMIAFGNAVERPKTTLIAKIRTTPVRKLIECLKPEHQDLVRERNSPNIYTKVLDVEAAIPHGCSGAPIIYEGKVIGVADGGLDGGGTMYCWAIPINELNLSPKELLEPEYSKLAKNDPGTIFKADREPSIKVILEETRQYGHGVADPPKDIDPKEIKRKLNSISAENRYVTSK